MSIMRATISSVRSHGFTLVETVVALAILALTLGVVYESFGWSLRRTAVLEKRELAWLTAQSLLSEIRARAFLESGSERGEAADRMEWHARIAPHEAHVAASSPIQAFDVVIEVSWRSRAGHRVQLQSIETSRVAP